jgi:hypothetical protein
MAPAKGQHGATAAARRRADAGASDALARMRERHAAELEAVTVVAREQRKVAELEARIADAWVLIGAALRDLGALGWGARQIADTIGIDLRRAGELLREDPSTSDENTESESSVTSATIEQWGEAELADTASTAAGV